MPWFKKILFWLKDVFRFREQSGGEAVKPFLEHLEELRWMIIRMAVVQGCATVLAFCYRGDLLRLLRAPLEGLHPAPQLITSGVGESLVISFELAFFTGLALAIPFHIYSVVSYILPALTRKERSLLLPGIAAGFLFFVGGVYVAYRFLLPATLQFFVNDAILHGFAAMWTWRAYFSFACWFCFGFGAMCEVPVIVVILAMLGLVSFQMLRRTRPYAYTIILVLTAIVTPTPDPVTFLMMAVPVLLMFEGCIWAVWFLDKRKPAGGEMVVALWLVAVLRQKRLARDGG